MPVVEAMSMVTVSVVPEQSQPEGAVGLNVEGSLSGRSVVATLRASGAVELSTVTPSAPNVERLVKL